MLQDHGRDVEQYARRRQQRAMLPRVYGDFIAGLTAWDWFVTITFRREAVSDLAVTQIGGYLRDIQRNTGKPVGLVLAKEFGSWPGRFHCHHLLITGVGRLFASVLVVGSLPTRFGRSEIRVFNPEQAAFLHRDICGEGARATAFRRHPGGHRSFLACVAGLCDWWTGHNPRPLILPRSFYRLGLGRWHRDLIAFARPL